MKQLKIILILITTFLVSGFLNQLQAAQSIYLVRHAEKVKDGAKDPKLTAKGLQRAKLLADNLRDAEIVKIFSTDYERTRQTAAPLANAIGKKAELYNPRDLKSFAERIKKIKGNILIVGHSNTTPMMVHLLGGDAHGDIDESEYDRLYHLTIENGKVRTELKRSEPVSLVEKARPLPFDGKKYSSGKNTYEMRLNGKRVGVATHRFQEDEKRYTIYEETRIEAMNIDAVIKIRLDKANLKSKSMSMSGNMGKPADIKLRWEGSNVAGHSLMGRAAYQKQGKLVVDRVLPENTFERSAAILLAHLYQVEEGKTYPFNWYNGYSDELKYIELSYQGEEKVRVPAGEFNTYKVQLLGGAPSQMFYISKEEKPKIVKIEVIASPWSYHLTESALN